MNMNLGECGRTSQIIETEIQYKCGYCGWFLPLYCEDYTIHKCLSHYDGNEHELVSDENYSLTVVSDGQVVPPTEEMDMDEQIISFVAERPALYKFSLPLKDRTQLKKNALWKEIFNLLGGKLSIEEIKNRWRYLRDCYMKAKKKFKEYRPSGSEGGERKEPSFRYFNAMSFLGDLDIQEKTISSVETHQTSKYTDALPSTSCRSTPQTPVKTPAAKSELTNINKGKKRRTNTDSDLENVLLSTLNEPRQNGVEGFAARIEEGLERLPYRKRLMTEIKMLQLLQDAEEDLN